MDAARAEGTSPDVSRCSGNPSALFVSEQSLTYMTDREFLSKLRERGFTDADAPSAMAVLDGVSQQHLVPYIRAVERFPEDMRTVKMAHDTLTFDRRFQSALFKYIGVFESKMRARYAAEMGERHGAGALCNPSLFLRREDYEKTFASFSNESARRARGRETPVWEAVELMSLGTLCRFYRNTADTAATAAVAASFGSKKDELSNWTRTITEVRNICAHFGSLVVRLQIPAMPKAIRGLDVPCPRRAPLFSVVLLAHLLERDIASDDANMNYSARLLSNVGEVVAEYADFCGGVVPISGFPGNWRGILRTSEPSAFHRWVALWHY